MIVAVWRCSPWRQRSGSGARSSANALLAMSYASNWARAAGEGMGMWNHTWSLAIEGQFYLTGRWRFCGASSLDVVAVIGVLRRWPGRRRRSGRPCHGRRDGRASLFRDGYTRGGAPARVRAGVLPCPCGQGSRVPGWAGPDRPRRFGGPGPGPPRRSGLAPGTRQRPRRGPDPLVGGLASHRTGTLGPPDGLAR